MIDENNLISGFDEFDLAGLLRRGDEATSAQLRELLGAGVADRIVAESTEEEAAFEGAAGLFAPPDPSLPELVLLHGITDCHLADVSGRRNRIWLDFLELVRGRYTRRLTLQPDGTGDQPGVVMETDGPLGKKYRKALRAWSAGRFRNRVFCYDWRRSVPAAAGELHGFLRGLESVAGGEKVVLVGHSMGGLVAAAMAACHDDWADMIAHCVFVGSPLGGSYSVPMAVLGKEPSFQQMDRLSLFEDLGDFQRMAASFPGLLDLLPNPDLLPEAADLYTQDGWPGEIKPAQEHLDASRELKAVLWSSPLLGKATHLVSQGHDTVAEMPWNEQHSDRNPEVLSREGDGAVLTKSSLAPGLPACRVSGKHGTLVNEAEVFAAVMAIARGESPELPPIGPRDLTGETMTASRGGAPAGLVVSTPAEREESLLGARMALSFASDAAVAARLRAAGSPGFDRSALRSEEFSWHNALSLAIASEDAYRSDQAGMRQRAIDEWGFAGFEDFDKDETQGFVGWDDAVVVLSFRGTEKKIGDWIRNLDLGTHDSGDDRYGKVHQGFHKAFKVVETELVALLARAGADRKKLWLTGHSLGGAVATIAGAELLERFPATGFYTYGQPKLGRTKLVEFYRRHCPDRFFRFVNDEDIVPRIPPLFKHVGSLFWFDDDGELRGSAPGGLMGPGALEEPAELSEEEFKAMQARLTELSEPGAPDAFFLPPPDSRIETLALIPGFSVSDHSITKQYIPIIRKHAGRA